MDLQLNRHLAVERSNAICWLDCYFTPEGNILCPLEDAGGATTFEKFPALKEDVEPLALFRGDRDPPDLPESTSSLSSCRKDATLTQFERVVNATKPKKYSYPLGTAPFPRATPAEREQ
jgi:hypothetical protein